MAITAGSSDIYITSLWAINHVIMLTIVLMHIVIEPGHAGWLRAEDNAAGVPACPHPAPGT